MVEHLFGAISNPMLVDNDIHVDYQQQHTVSYVGVAAYQTIMKQCERMSLYDWHIPVDCRQSSPIPANHVATYAELVYDIGVIENTGQRELQVDCKGR